MTRKLLTALETQLLHPPPWRALQLGVVALHSSGVRLVSVVWFFFFLVGFFWFFPVLFCFFSPSCTCKPDTQGERRCLRSCSGSAPPQPYLSLVSLLQ